MKTVSLVIPIKNEDKSLYDFLNNIDKLKESLFANLKVLLVDDSDPDFKMGLANYYLLGKRQYTTKIRGAGNYGDSIKMGFINMVHSDIIILMDIDHPLSSILSMVNLINSSSVDMVIAQDENNNNERVVTRFICDRLFGIKLSHPTCGFMAFRGDVLLYKIPFYNAESKRDIIHLEFILMAIRNNLDIDTINFCTKDSGIKHNYNMKRNMLWLIDAFKMKIYDVIYNKYHIDRLINEDDELLVVESN